MFLFSSSFSSGGPGGNQTGPVCLVFLICSGSFDLFCLVIIPSLKHPRGRGLGQVGLGTLVYVCNKRRGMGGTHFLFYSGLDLGHFLLSSGLEGGCKTSTRVLIWRHVENLYTPFFNPVALYFILLFSPFCPFS